MEPLEWSKKGQQEVAQYIGQQWGGLNCLYPTSRRRPSSRHHEFPH
jgi:hypothetical protein